MTIPKADVVGVIVLALPSVNINIPCPEPPDVEFDDDDDIKCRHVKDNKVRAVVVATNEGGFNTTGVCVDCLIEAFRDNNLL